MDAVLASSAAERTVLEGGRGPRATSGVVEKARAQAVLLSTVLVSVGSAPAPHPPTGAYTVLIGRYITGYSVGSGSAAGIAV